MSDNIVGILREKNDEADLDRVLKTSMGGYTKKSVQDYLAQLKRQQQITTESFNRDRQALLDEKEKLQEENASLKNRMVKAVADYTALKDSVSAIKADGAEVTVEDLLQLKSQIRVLEKEKDEANSRVAQSEKLLEQNQMLMSEKDSVIEQTKQESAMYQGLLVTNQGERDQLKKTVTEQATQIEQLQGEIRFLKEIVSDGNVAELNNRIAQLLGDVEKLNGELRVRGEEQQNFMKQIETLTQQEEMNRKVNEQMRASLDQALAQNETMEAANIALSQQLEQCMHENIAMLRAQSDLRVKNAILSRKLDAENVRTLIADNEVASK